MRIARYVISGLIALFALLCIPDAEPTYTLAARRGFAWNQDARWDSLSARYAALRATEPHALEQHVDSVLAHARLLLHVVSAVPCDPRDSVLHEIENFAFDMAPMIARCPQRLDAYVHLIGRMRAVVKNKSQSWNMTDTVVRDRLYRMIFGGRFAAEQVLLQAPRDSVQALVLEDDEPSATPAAMLQGITIHSGDILLSRGDVPTSALIARGNDYPGTFSHVALALVDSATHAVSILESIIEGGAHVVSTDEYLRDPKQRIMVLRPRADLAVIRADPMLPHRAAQLELREITRHHVPYDFTLNHRDHSALYCSELVAQAYELVGMNLWMGLSTVSTPGVASWLAALGVRHFEMQEPSDLEYDPQLRVVAEWRDPQRLFRSRLDDLVTAVMLDQAERGDRLRHAWYKLPGARVIKLWSVVVNWFGHEPPIPEGLSATQALRTDGYRTRHTLLEDRTLLRAEALQRSQGYPPLYWQLQKIVREEEAATRGAL